MIPRRSFVRILAMACLPGWAVLRTPCAAERTDIARLLDSLVPERDQARSIGRAALRSGVAEPSSSRLLRELSGGAPGAIDADSIRRQIRDDFDNGRMVQVDGWLLSPTEVRIYALAALA